MQCQLKIVSGPERLGEVIPLVPGENIIGRVSPPCSIKLNGVKVSKQHCLLLMKEDFLLARDLGSSNGVYVNGKKISDQKLNQKDRLVVGEYIFEVGVDK